MTLLFHDGFDGSTTSDGASVGITGNGYLGIVGWLTSSNAQSTSGREPGGRAIYAANVCYYDLPANKTTLVVGFAMIGAAADNRAVLSFYDAGTIQLCMSVSGGPGAPVMQVRRGNESGTVLGQTGPGVYAFNVWTFWEIKVTFNQTTGSVEVRKNGSPTPVINVTGIDTCNTANEYANQIRLESNSNQIVYDDFYVCDTAGSLNNDFLGDVASYAYDPDADTLVEWTLSSGSTAWSLLDETPYNDTDFIETSTNAQKVRMTHENVDADDVVYGVTQHVFVRKTDVTLCSARAIQKVGGVDYSGPTLVLSTSYQGANRLMETNPNTGNQWTPAEINASEFGVEAII